MIEFNFFRIIFRRIMFWLVARKPSFLNHLLCFKSFDSNIVFKVMFMIAETARKIWLFFTTYEMVYHHIILDKLEAQIRLHLIIKLQITFFIYKQVLSKKIRTFAMTLLRNFAPYARIIQNLSEKPNSKQTRSPSLCKWNVGNKSRHQDWIN